MMRKGIALLSVVALLVSASAVASVTPLSGTGQPVTKVSSATYKIIAAGAEIAGGTLSADGKNNINISASENIPANTVTTYDVQLQDAESATPVHVTVSLDPVKGRASVEGKGLKRFETVEFGNDSTMSRATADWAGLIRSETDWRLDSGGEPGFKVAFYQNSDIARDFNPNPLLVRAQISIGGVRIDCSTNISICNTGHRTNLLNSIGQIVQTWKDMTAQLSVILMEHTFIVGTFMDAKMQLETQRLYQEQIAEAHRDYHPSDTMCRVGSFVKSVATTEARAAMNKEAMNSVMNQIYENGINRSASEGYAEDVIQRLKQFREKFCNPRDNNDGLKMLCDHDQNTTTAGTVGGTAPNGIGAPSTRPASPTPPAPGTPPLPHPYERMNKDIDYTRTADFPLTLDVDFTDDTLTEDEEDIFALARNIYWPAAGNPAPEKDLAWQKSERYIDHRSILAKQSVAHNTFIEIASMKSRSNPAFGANSGWNFMKSMMREFGLTDPQIHGLVGSYPSYYAQMEVLTKKMFQNPDFYTNLYDKPANVDRINASLTAIQLMQQRDFLESRHRMEMLNSLILESALARDYAIVNNALTGGAARLGQ